MLFEITSWLLFHSPLPFTLLFPRSLEPTYWQPLNTLKGGDFCKTFAMVLSATILIELIFESSGIYLLASSYFFDA